MPRLPRPALATWGEGRDASRPDSDVAPIACIRGVSDLQEAQRRCARLTPRVGRLPDGLELDLRGCERLLLGGRFAVEGADVAETAAEAEWPALAAALHRRLGGVAARQDAELRVGVGPSRTVAWLAATLPEPLGRAWRAVPPAQLAAFLGPLPLAVLHPRAGRRPHCDEHPGLGRDAAGPRSPPAPRVKPVDCPQPFPKPSCARAPSPGVV